MPDEHTPPPADPIADVAAAVAAVLFLVCAVLVTVGCWQLFGAAFGLIVLGAFAGLACCWAMSIALTRRPPRGKT